MLEDVEKYVFDNFISGMVVEENGERKISREDFDRLQMAPHEKNFIMYILKSKNIKIIGEKITKDDRSPYVRDHDYGDIQGHDLQQLDEPVMSKIEYSQTNDIVAEDYSELDKYLETRFIPSYVLLKQRKNDAGEKEFYPSIRLHHITSLKLSEAEFEHVMNYLKEKNIRVGGKDSTVDGEFENYDYVTTYKESELPKTVAESVNIQNLAMYNQTKDEKLREKIIEDNMRLVPYVVQKYATATGIDKNELKSYGYEGLILAVDRFDLNVGNAFSTYAVAYIKGCVLSGITETFVGKRDNFYYDYVNAKMAVEKENGLTLAEAPDLIEDVIDLLQATGKIKDKVNDRDYAKRRIMALAIGNVSLNNPNLVEELLVEGEMVDSRNLEEQIMQKEAGRELNDMLDTLTEKESDVLRFKFGMYDGEVHTAEETGQLFGATKERIRQIENKGIRKLRHPSRAKHIRDFYN